MFLVGLLRYHCRYIPAGSIGTFQQDLSRLMVDLICRPTTNIGKISFQPFFCDFDHFLARYDRSYTSIVVTFSVGIQFLLSIM
jgi:hypothetical protein